ncbi:MAG: transposase [Pirellulaceae bacterium]
MQPGCRTREVTLVTTLLDPAQYPAAELAQLYADRWQIEVNLRHLKQTLHLDVLRCKTVAGVHKELLMIALAYNLVRLVIWRAAQTQQVSVHRVSFIDALRWLCHFRAGDELCPVIVRKHRRGRHEPRVRKRRPKQYPSCNNPAPPSAKPCYSDDLRTIFVAFGTFYFFSVTGVRLARCERPKYATPTTGGRSRAGSHKM